MPAAKKPGRPPTPSIDLATTRQPYVTLYQLAAYLGCARRTLYYHIEKGALPVVQRRGLIRVRLQDARIYAGLTSAITTR